MIHVYGYLRKRFTDKLDAKVSSAFEAIQALNANYPGFRDAIVKTRYYVIKRGKDLKHGKCIHPEEVHMNFNENDWHILPVPKGYGGGAKGAITMIVGVILTVIAYIYAPPAGAGLTAMLFGEGAMGLGLVGTMGIAMILGGISQMLTPSLKTSDYASREGEKKQSYLINSPVNVVESGSTIPVAYGTVYIGSVNIGAGLKVNDVTV